MYRNVFNLKKKLFGFVNKSGYQQPILNQMDAISRQAGPLLYIIPITTSWEHK